MERRDQERDLGIPNSITYNPSKIFQDSSVKLPLAPIISTPPDRRGNAPLSVRRGTSIFSPNQTLDQPLDNNFRHSPPPQPLQKEHQTDSRNQNPTPQRPNFVPAAVSTTTDATASIRYRECLKNHAASMGGHVVDGCGEFMPSGDEGTAEYLRCAACDCHRNFHRREAEGEPQQQQQQPLHYPYNPNSGNLRTPQSQATYSLPSYLKNSHSAGAYAPPTMFNFGGGAGAESSSEDLNIYHTSGGGEEHASLQPSSGSKKRFRTKFNQDQKDRMQEFASKIGWRIQKQDEQEVHQFCNEVGVKKQVFKVWMHNNKQAMKKRQI